MEGTGSFGRWLQERLGVRTYGQLAEYVGVSTSTVSRWVNGQSMPERRNVHRLAAYLKVEPAEIEAMLTETPPAAQEVLDRLTDPRLRLAFYDAAFELTREEQASVIEAVEHAISYARSVRGEAEDARGSPARGGGS